MNVEPMHRDAASIEVVIKVALYVEHPRGNLSILPKESIFVATLYKEHSIRILSFDGEVLLLHWSVFPTTSTTTTATPTLGHTAPSRGR